MIAKNTFLGILFFGMIQISFAQQDDFNKIYYKAATDYIFSDPDRAIKIADSLYLQAENKNQEIRSLMLKAGVYLGKPDLKKSRDIARQADAVAVKANDYQWQFRTKGFIASIYQKIQFVNEGMEVLNEMEDILSKIDNPTQRANLSLLNIQSKANLLKDKVSSDSLLFYLEKGKQFYLLVKELDEGNYLIAYNEHLLGLTYYELKDFEQSNRSFQNTIEALEKYNNPNYHLYGFVYAGLGGIAYRQNKDTIEANHYFSKALNLMNSTSASQRNVFLTTELRDYYQFLKEYEKSEIYDQLLTETIKEAEQERKELAKDFFVSNYQQTQKNQNTVKVFYVLIILLSLVLVYMMIKLYRFNKKDRVVIASVVNDVLPEEKDIKKSNGMVIATETEKAILEKLEVFEKEEMFLDSQLNIESLTVFCQTNNRYLSEVIKKKDKDFHSYINRLRIEFIMNKLKQDPVFRKYKIAVLAEKAGFSSHSAFSANFKALQGMTPSQFIKKLNAQMAK